MSGESDSGLPAQNNRFKKYTCLRCGYHTHDLAKFRRHCDNRRNICLPNLENIPVDFDDFVARVSGMTDFKCAHCNKYFATKRTLNNHLQRIAAQQMPADENHMDLHVFGVANATARQLCPSMLAEARKRPMEYLERIIQLVHFDPQHPELHNIYVPNVRANAARIWTGDQWKYESKHFVVRRLLNHVYQLLELANLSPTNFHVDIFTDICFTPQGQMYRRTRDAVWNVILQNQHIMLDKAKASEKALRRKILAHSACISAGMIVQQQQQQQQHTAEEHVDGE